MSARVRHRAALALVMLGACHVDRPYPPPTADELRAYVESIGRDLATLRVEARSEYVTTKQRVRATVMILVSGDRLRFDVLSPVGTALQSMVVRGTTYTLLDTSKERFETGDAGSCGLGRVLPTPLSASDVARLLRGSVPLLAATQEVAWDGRLGAEILRVVAADGRRQEVRLKGERNRWTMVRSEVFDSKGDLELRIETGLDFVRLSSETKRESLELRFRRFERNVALADSFFEITPPPGMPTTPGSTCN